MTKVAPKLRKLKNGYDCEWEEMGGKMPDEPTLYIRSDLVGCNITKIRDIFYKELRISIAHLNPKKGPLPYNIEDEQLVSGASTLLKIISYHLLEILGRNIYNLALAGLSESDINAAVNQE